MFNKIHRGILSLMLLTAGLLLGNASHAAPGFPTPLLNPTFINPDIAATNLLLSYTYGGGSPTNNGLTLVQTGTSTGTYKDPSNNPWTINGMTYSLSAILNANTNDLISGTLTITGGINTGGYTIPNGSTLLTANLTDFGTDYTGTLGDQSGTFDFRGSVTSYYNGVGGNLNFGPNLAVVFSSANLNPFFQDAANFSGTGAADNATDISQVPEPGTLVLLAAGGLALCGVRRQRPVRAT